jgi:hypothetical protein
VIPLLFVVLGAAALIAGAAILRSLSGYRLGRLLGAARPIPIADAIAIAQRREPRYVAIAGRIESDDVFEDAAQRPLVFRRTTLEARVEGRWSTFEDSLEVVPFEIHEGLDAIGLDATALGKGVVAVPRVSDGTAADLGERVPPEVPRSAPARATVRQLSSIDHALVMGVPSLDSEGRPTMTAGRGRPLVVTNLEVPEAMRVLAGGSARGPRLAAALLAAGSALLAVGLAWWLVSAVVHGPSTALAAAAAVPSATIVAPLDSAAPSGLSGDTRSSGAGPGLVGAPALAILGVGAVAIAAVVATIGYVRLTGGPGPRTPRSP